MKTGNIIVFRKEINPKFSNMIFNNDFTSGKSYKLKNIDGHDQYIYVHDDSGESWTFSTDPNNTFYWVKYFYTKEELREGRLKELGI